MSHIERIDLLVDLLLGGFALADDNALVDDATLSRESMENSPVPIQAVPPASLTPDDAVPGFDPPLH
jgi:hypothetical protein